MKPRGTKFLAIPLTFLLPLGLSSLVYGAGPTPKQAKIEQTVREQTAAPTVTIGENERISGSIENRPLSEILRIMSEKSLFDIRGPLPTGEPISVTFSNLTLPDALKRLMRGYNYVLMNQGAAKKPLLMVMGRAERASTTEQKVPQPQPVAPPKPANQGPEPGTSYVPPATAEQAPPVARAPQSASVRSRPDGQTGSAAPAQPRPDQSAPQGQGAERGPIPETPPSGGNVSAPRPENRGPEEVQGVGTPPQQQQSGQPQEPGQQGPAAEPSHPGVKF